MPLFLLDPSLAMSEVYSLYFPQAKDVVRALRTHPDFDEWFDEAWVHDRPHCQDHVPAQFLEDWRNWSGLPLEGYPHRYVSGGSSEVLRELLMKRKETPRLCVFEGEYDGYYHTAAAHELGVTFKTRRLNVDEIEIPEEWIKMEHGVRPVFWISQPSALDGEYWEGLRAFMDRVSARCPEARFIVDVAYHGLGRETQYIPELSDERIIAVVFSFSKVFGIYKWRAGGVFSREPIPGLVYNRYFSGLLGQKIAIDLMQRYAPGDIPRTYAPQQAELVRRLIEMGMVPEDTVPSNTLLLARSKTPHIDLRCNRAEGFTRICLSPGLHGLIKGVA